MVFKDHQIIYPTFFLQRNWETRYFSITICHTFLLVLVYIFIQHAAVCQTHILLMHPEITFIYPPFFYGPPAMLP